MYWLAQRHCGKKSQWCGLQIPNCMIWWGWRAGWRAADLGDGSPAHTRSEPVSPGLELFHCSPHPTCAALMEVALPSLHGSGAKKFQWNHCTKHAGKPFIYPLALRGTWLIARKKINGQLFKEAWYHDTVRMCFCLVWIFACANIRLFAVDVFL